LGGKVIVTNLTFTTLSSSIHIKRVVIIMRWWKGLWCVGKIRTAEPFGDPTYPLQYRYVVVQLGKDCFGLLAHPPPFFFSCPFLVFLFSFSFSRFLFSLPCSSPFLSSPNSSPYSSPFSLLPSSFSLLPSLFSPPPPRRVRRRTSPPTHLHANGKSTISTLANHLAVVNLVVSSWHVKRNINLSVL